ncbi:MAG: DUF1848 domain-containing protein [Deltaproteobacteria bacterium]|nr:DUF1848 domain-containing protein [Deltaproteobacteria bacterium]
MKSRRLILSASRRTDLPGFHGATCAERIRGRIKRMRTRRLAGVVFWTRHPKAFLAGGSLHDLVATELENPIVNLTVTGLGSTALEPGTPSTKEVLRDLPKLVAAFHGEPWRIRWRFDPLLKAYSSPSAFTHIAHAMASLGILTCTFSFPAYRSLKGDLTPQFERARIPRWRRSEKISFLKAIARTADDLGIELLSCSEPENVELSSSVKTAQCIPVDVLERGDPNKEPLALCKDRSQRTHCRCVESEDIGDYERDRCKGGCVYCYSKAGGPSQ